MNNQLLDHVTDNNPAFLFWADSVGDGLPDFVKAASITPAEECANLHSCFFADINNRRNPIHTKAATVLSAAWMLHNGETGDNFRRLKDAACFHGVDHIVDELEHSNTLSHAKEASTLVAALELPVRAGEEAVGFYPIGTAHDIAESASAISKDRANGSLPLELYKKACVALVERAEKLGMPMGEICRGVRRDGEAKAPDTRWFAEQVGMRKKAAAVWNADTQAEADRIAAGAGAEEFSIDDPKYFDRFNKWAEELLALDRRSGVSYHGTIEDPFSAMFSGVPMGDLRKAAASTLDILGAKVPLDALKAVPETALSHHLPATVAETVRGWRKQASARDIAGELSALSEDHREVLLELMVAHG